jgi:hypothetical protein
VDNTYHFILVEPDSLPLSLKNKHGTQFTPMFQWPDKSVSFGVTQPLAWKRSGLMVRPSVQVR